MKKINYSYTVQECGKSASLVISLINYFSKNNKEKIIFLTEYKKELESLISFLNLIGVNASGFANDLSSLETKENFIYFHDKANKIDLFKYNFDYVISLFSEELYEKLFETNSDSDNSKEINFVDITTKLPYRNIQKSRDFNINITEIVDLEKYSKNIENLDSKITSNFKLIKENNYSPSFSDLHFWCSEQSKETLTNVVCNIANLVSKISPSDLVNLSLNRFFIETKRSDFDQVKRPKVYEFFLSHKNKDSLNEEKIRSFFLLHPSTKNEDIVFIRIGQDVKVEISTTSSKSVLSYILNNKINDEFFKIENVASKFTEKRGGGSFFNKDKFGGGGFNRERRFGSDNRSGGYRGGDRSSGGGYRGGDRSSSDRPRSGGFRKFDQEGGSSSASGFENKSQDSFSSGYKSNNYGNKDDFQNKEGGEKRFFKRFDNSNRKSDGYNKDRGFKKNFGVKKDFDY